MQCFYDQTRKRRCVYTGDYLLHATCLYRWLLNKGGPIDRFDCFLYQEVHEFTFYVHLVKNIIYFFTVLFLIPKGVVKHVYYPGKVISIAPVISKPDTCTR